MSYRLSYRHADRRAAGRLISPLYDLFLPSRAGPIYPLPLRPSAESIASSPDLQSPRISAASSAGYLHIARYIPSNRRHLPPRLPAVAPPNLLSLTPPIAHPLPPPFVRNPSQVQHGPLTARFDQQRPVTRAPRPPGLAMPRDPSFTRPRTERARRHADRQEAPHFQPSIDSLVQPLK
jgi:hypothetical protein